MSRGPWNRPQPAVITEEAQLPTVCTPVEAGRLLRCTPEYVTRMASVGAIRGFKLGNRWRFRKEDLLDYLDRQAKAALAGCR